MLFADTTPDGANWMVLLASAIGGSIGTVITNLGGLLVQYRKTADEGQAKLQEASRKEQLDSLVEKLSEAKMEIEMLKKKTEKCETDHSEALKDRALLQGKLEMLEKFQFHDQNRTSALETQQARHEVKLETVAKAVENKVSAAPAKQEP